MGNQLASICLTTGNNFGNNINQKKNFLSLNLFRGMNHRGL
jgi:hypothetical protein